MSVKVTLIVKKEIKLEKNTIKKKKKDSLISEEKKVLKNLKKDLEKLQNNQYNITYGLNYLFNEEDCYYEPKEMKSAFDGNYMSYESKGDKDAKLARY